MLPPILPRLRRRPAPGQSHQRTSKASGSASVKETPFTASYDAADRLTGLVLKGTGAGGADETCTLAYDDNGNLARKRCGASLTTYTWDARDRLTQISAPGMSASFAYDALGRRTSRTVNGQTTTYVYDGIQAIAEIHGGERSALLTGLDLDEAIARYSAAGNRTQLTDALGSVIAEARADASLATRYAYTPYGQTVHSGEPSASATQYTGRENDGTGLYYYRARYYDPLSKRFVQSDPIGLAGGVNLYAYVGGNPLSYVDPLGLDRWADPGWGGGAGQNWWWNAPRHPLYDPPGFGRPPVVATPWPGEGPPPSGDGGFRGWRPWEPKDSCKLTVRVLCGVTTAGLGIVFPASVPVSQGCSAVVQQECEKPQSCPPSGDTFQGAP